MLYWLKLLPEKYFSCVNFNMNFCLFFLGVSPSDFVTDLPVQEFTAPLPSSPVVSPYNVENVKFI